MDEGTPEEFKGFADPPSNKTHRNVPRTLLHRDTGLRQRHNGVPIEFQWAAEDKLVLKDYEEMKCQLPGVPTRSTFLMVFSPDGKRVASTHGNHKIYVTDLTSGKNINTLTGHPRTPWCIAFHPSSNQILASGCLGGQVRVWDLHGGSEIWITKSQTVIASIAFHPTERMLVIATYNELYFWDWSQPEPYATCHTSNEKEKVRYVTFDPLGCKLITGISNAPAVVSQWDRVGPPTTANTPGQVHGPSTSSGLSHEQDQRRITICYRSLVEQYEQLVQRYYDLTRSRATPTMDRGTDPMDLDPAALGEETLRLRHAGCTTAMRCQRGTCPSAAQTGPESQTGSTQSSSTQSSSNQASSTLSGSGIGPDERAEQQARWRRLMNTNLFCLSDTSTDAISSTLGAHSSTRANSTIGSNSSTIGNNNSETGGNSLVIGESSPANDSQRPLASILSTLRTSESTIGPSLSPPRATSSPLGRRDSTDTGSYMEQNRNRRTLSRETSVNRRNFLRLLREHHSFPSPESQSAAGASPSGAGAGRPGTSPAQSDAGSATSTPRTRQSTTEETRGERRSLSHIRTYDVSRTGPVRPSFSSDVEPPRSPELPRRFFFSQRSAFQPQAPRSAATEQSYAFLEERARRLDCLTRGLYQRRATGQAPPPPPPPPPAHETADIGVRYGIQLLSRHIDNMQRLCRARLEILQLQQIRRMWEDLQLQIRSLHVASRGAGSDPPPPLPPRRHAATEPAPKTANYAERDSATAAEGRVRHDLYRYLNYRSQQSSRLSRITRRNAEQRRSVAWRHYSGRRPGQEVSSFRQRPCPRTTTESSTQAGHEAGCEGDTEESHVESSSAGPSNGAAAKPLAEEGSTARGVKRSRSELESEAPSIVTQPTETPVNVGPATSTVVADAGTAGEEQPTAGQGRTTTQSLRSMIARLESLVRDQRELAASVSPGLDHQDVPRPTAAAGSTLSAEERLASALQNEEYESGRLYRSTLSRQSRLEDWEYTRESTRLRARQVLSLMVESLTQFFEENGLSHNTPHAVLDDQIYNLFILLQLALELTDLLLAQLASTRRELEHQWVHRLRSPVALEASSFRDEFRVGDRPTSRRGRPSAARRPLFHPRAPRDESGSARTAGSLPSSAGTGTSPTRTPRPLPTFTSMFGHDLHLLPVTRPSSSSISSILTQPLTSFGQGMLPQDTSSEGPQAQSSPVDTDVSVVDSPVPDSARPTGRMRVALHTETSDRRPCFRRVGSTPRAERFRAEAFRVQTPAERRNDEREFMVQVRRYQNAVPAVPAVRVNDVLVVDPTAMSQPRQGPPSPPNPRAPWATYGPSEAEPEGGPWRPQRFLHPRYRLEPPHDTPYEIAGGGDGFNILRVMGPAFATEHVVLADSPVMPNHRIQAWDFTDMYIPDITDVEKNVVASECKIHNDASVDVSSDGKLLVTLLPSGRLSMTTMLGIYSLEWETLGQCLYTTRFDQNAVSVSLSPVSRHLLVGLASRRVGAIMTDLHTMAQIFRLDKAAGPGSSRGRLCHLRDIEHGREQPFMSINCIRWAPVAGQGLVFGTNNGQLKVLR